MISPASSSAQSEASAPLTVRVVAPATLEAGYSFEASVDGRTFVVVVPDGGVKRGAEFEVPYPHRSNDDINRIQEESFENGDDSTPHEDQFGVPRGRWRTSLCSCCDVFTQSTFWLGLFCIPIQVAQLLTRLKLTWQAEEGPPEETALTYNRIILALIITLAFSSIAVLVYLTLFLFSLFMLYVGMLLRGFMRRKYAIPAGPCGYFGERAEDCCFMLWCGCCSSIQMARHTHDDKEWPGYWLSTTGLELDAPDVV
jgi:Cys-rich protein (TIGR01571 family)